MTPKAHVWHPTTDLPDDAKSLTDGELEPLGRIWERSLLNSLLSQKLFRLS
jgi:hypothetical protein